MLWGWARLRPSPYTCSISTPMSFEDAQLQQLRVRALCSKRWSLDQRTKVRTSEIGQYPSDSYARWLARKFTCKTSRQAPADIDRFRRRRRSSSSSIFLHARTPPLPHLLRPYRSLEQQMPSKTKILSPIINCCKQEQHTQRVRHFRTAGYAAAVILNGTAARTYIFYFYALNFNGFVSD